MQEILGELLELVLNKEPALLLEFGPLLLELQVQMRPPRRTLVSGCSTPAFLKPDIWQVDPLSSVRKFLADVIEKARAPLRLGLQLRRHSDSLVSSRVAIPSQFAAVQPTLLEPCLVAATALLQARLAIP